MKSLPAGFDPIFNPLANNKYANDNSHIKIKPMRLSNGFEHQIDSMKSSKEAAMFENTETSQHSGHGGGNVSRVSSIGTIDSQGIPII